MTDIHCNNNNNNNTPSSMLHNPTRSQNSILRAKVAVVVIFLTVLNSNSPSSLSTCWVASLTSASSTTSNSRNGSGETPPHPPKAMEWKTLSPSSMTLTTSSPSTSTSCRFAKDERYLTSVLEAWTKDDESTWSKTTTTTMPKSVETRPIVYSCRDFSGSSSSSKNDENFSKKTQNPLYGHLIRPQHLDSSSSPSSTSTSTTDKRVLLFHTAAGPHDVFLFWKASYLASNLGCTVMISDILGDDNGWGWDSDRTKYNLAREDLVRNDGKLLQARVQAAIDTISTFDRNSDKDGQASTDIKLACLGWCLGAQPILELSRMEQNNQCSDVVALATFHGVFRREGMDAATKASSTSPDSNDCSTTPKKMMICNGADDPFVARNDLSIAHAMFQQTGWDVNIKQYPNSKHGFTNPAQAFNANEAFDYNEEAANDSWKEVVQLLREQFKLSSPSVAEEE